jgi:hypothetical protein
MFTKVKSIIAAGKQVHVELKQLQLNLQKLSQASASIAAFQDEVERAIDRFQFKSKPRLDKINEIVKNLNK